MALIERGRRGHPVLWGLIVDPVVALLLFLALGGTLVVIVSLLNAVTGVEFVDLPILLTAPFDLGQYWWLYLMLFSTALPTVLRGFLAIASLQTLLPLKRRAWLAAHIGKAQSGTAVDGIWGSTCIGLYLAGSVVVPLLVLYGAAQLLWHWGLGTIVHAYRDVLVHIFAGL